MSITARIFSPSKTAMQSGRSKTKKWLLEYGSDVKNTPEPLMGWNSGGTLQQIRLEFDTKAAAIAYAEKNNIKYELVDSRPRVIEPKNYAANFATDRRTAF